MPTDIITNIRPILDSVEAMNKKPVQQPSSADKKAVRQELPGKLQFSSLTLTSDDKDNARNIDDVIDSLNQLSQSVGHDIRFSIDREHDRVIIKVVDSETKELIRTIPPEETVNLEDVFAHNSGTLLKASI